MKMEPLKKHYIFLFVFTTVQKVLSTDAIDLTLRNAVTMDEKIHFIKPFGSK